MKVLENSAQPLGSLSMSSGGCGDDIYVLPTQPSRKNTLNWQVECLNSGPNPDARLLNNFKQYPVIFCLKCLHL